METIWEVLYDKIIVRRAAAKVMTASGLEVPEAAREKPNEGLVVKVGCGRLVNGLPVPLLLQPGMSVLFNKFAGVPLSDDEELLVLREDEVLAYMAPVD